MKLITPHLIPSVPHKITLWTLVYTVVVLTIVFLGAIFLKNAI